MSSLSMEHQGSTIKVILSIVASKKMMLIQFDVKTALLYGKLDEEIYMKQPEEYRDLTNRISRLNKSLFQRCDEKVKF